MSVSILTKRKVTTVKSKKFDTVKRYYDTGLWPINRVRDAVAKNWIAPEEYEEITGERYDD